MDPCSQSLHDSKLPFQLSTHGKGLSSPSGEGASCFFSFHCCLVHLTAANCCALERKLLHCSTNWPSSDFLTIPVPRRAASLLGSYTLQRWTCRITCMILNQICSCRKHPPKPHANLSGDLIHDDDRPGPPTSRPIGKGLPGLAGERAASTSELALTKQLRDRTDLTRSQ